MREGMQEGSERGNIWERMQTKNVILATKMYEYTLRRREVNRVTGRAENIKINQTY